MDEAALIEELARALAVADRIEICSDAQYRHSSYGIKAAALLPIIRRIHNEAIEKCAQKVEDYRVDWANGTPENLQLAAEDVRTLRITDHA